MTRLPEKIALIAGKGMLARHVYDSCQQKGIKCFMIAVENQYSEEFFYGVNYETFPIYAITKILDYLSTNGVEYVVFAGKIKRPNIAKFLLDARKARQFFKMIARSGMSDSSLIDSVVRFVEQEGFKVIGVGEIADHLLIKEGNLTRVQIDDEIREDIRYGRKVLKSLEKAGSRVSLVQALVVQNGLVLGIEDAGGTDNLIKKCGAIKQSESKPILIKMSRDGQDKRINLPCIAPIAIQNLYDAGFYGVALESGHSIMIEPEKTIEMANNFGLFIYGM